MIKVITLVSIGKPGIIFKISISLLLKNLGFFSITEVEGSHFCVTHQCNSVGEYFASHMAHLINFLL